MDIKINKDDFKSILSEYEDNRMSKYDNMPEHEFSEKFEGGMEKLLRRRKAPYYPLISSKRRVALLTAVLTLLVSMTTVLATDSLRESFFGFVEEIFTDRSHITTEEPGVAPDIIHIRYDITYIPDGYSKTGEKVYENMVESYYFNESTNQSLSFEQSTINGYVSIIDTENTRTEPISLENGMVGFYWSNKGIQNITVKNDEYIFDISGQIPKEEIIKVAESIKK